MSKREHRRFTAEQKLEILKEADQPGVTVSEVCRRHALAVSVFYRWRAVAQGGSAVALKRDAQRTARKDDDVLTRGATLLGAASRIAAQFPGLKIVGFVLVWAMTDGEIVTIRDPRVGTIEDGESLRRP